LYGAWDYFSIKSGLSSFLDPEMEFLNGIFSRGSCINSSLFRLEFLSGFYPHFSVLQNPIHD
jgi:hypothetical protein